MTNWSSALRAWLVCLILSAAVQHLQAQQSETGSWYMYFSNMPLNERWNWHNELQYRNFNLAGDLEQLLLRTGIGLNLSPGNNNLLLGYGYVLSGVYPDDGSAKRLDEEHRVFQQFTTRQSFGRVHLQHRYRFEQRWFSDDFRTRWRYFLGANLPLSAAGMEPGVVYLSMYNELFINGGGTLFDRNRSFAALGYFFMKNLRLEAGMMVQLYEKSRRAQFQLAVFNRLPFFE